jgi:DNA-binding NarL/FixJ family response regulator
VLIVTTEVDEYVFQALRVGASGFLGKGVGPDELIEAIRTVDRGDALLSPAATRALIARFLTQPDRGDPQVPDRLALLTDREREVLALVATGLSNDEIARELVVSPHTAKTHVKRAMVKLGAHDRAQLVVIAYETGLVRPAPGDPRDRRLEPPA